MKTPKRDAVDLTGINHIHVPLLRRQIHSRWKRKNRIKQLKHTISRQRKEIEWLKAALRCIEHIVHTTQTEEGISIFIPTLERYEP